MSIAAPAFLEVAEREELLGRFSAEEEAFAEEEAAEEALEEADEAADEAADEKAAEEPEDLAELEDLAASEAEEEAG